MTATANVLNNKNIKDNCYLLCVNEEEDEIEIV